MLGIVTPRFPLDSLYEVPKSRGGNDLKGPAQRPTLAAPRTFAQGRLKDHSLSRKCSPWALRGRAGTGV
jgi:hypothetical protein